MRVWLLLLIGLTASLHAEAPVYTLAVGPVNAAEHESADCSCTVGYGADALVLNFHPKNMLCARARELIGKSIRLQAVVE